MSALVLALVELLKLLKPLMEAYQKHEKDAVRAEIDGAFERLKDAKTKDEQAKALSDLDSNWKR